MQKIQNRSLKVITHEKGSIRKMIDKNDTCFEGFGEIYMSDIKFRCIKGWKLHTNKTSNLIVVHGYVNIVAWSPERPNLFNSYYLGLLENKNYNYSRITIGPNIWFAFMGLHKPISRVLNLSNTLNSETISRTMDIKDVNYKWSNL